MWKYGDTNEPLNPTNIQWHFYNLHMTAPEEKKRNETFTYDARTWVRVSDPRYLKIKDSETCFRRFKNWTQGHDNFYSLSSQF